MGFMDHVVTESAAYDDGIADLQDYDTYQEGCIFIECMNLSADERKALVESPEFLALEAKGLIGRKTIVKLKVDDDLTRRETMAAFQLAKEANDPLWDKLALNRVRERELIGKLRTKYRNKAAKISKQGQRDYIKRLRGGGPSGSQMVTKNDIDNRNT